MSSVDEAHYIRWLGDLDLLPSPKVEKAPSDVQCPERKSTDSMDCYSYVPSICCARKLRILFPKVSKVIRTRSGKMSALTCRHVFMVCATLLAADSALDENGRLAPSLYSVLIS